MEKEEIKKLLTQSQLAVVERAQKLIKELSICMAFFEGYFTSKRDIESKAESLIKGVSDNE